MKTNEKSSEAESQSQGINDAKSSSSSSPNTGATKTNEVAVADAADDEDDDEGQPADTATFPQQLWDAIEQETTREGGILTHSQPNAVRVLEWLPAGGSFIIRDKAIFETEVLTKYFNRCKFLSFTRKLYRWGFRQAKSSTQIIKIYAHKHFVRSDRQRCIKLRSIVKPPPACHQLQLQAQYPPGYNVAHPDQVPPGCAGTLDIHQRYGIMGNNAAVAPGHHVFPPQADPPLLQIRGNDILNSSSIGVGERPIPMQNSQFVSRGGFGMASTSIIGLGERPSPMQNSPFSGGSLGMTSTSSIGLGERPGPMQNSQFSRGSLGVASTDMLETRLHLDKLEQSRRQIMNMLNDTPMLPRTGPSLINQPMPQQPPFANSYNPQMPPQPPPSAAIAPSNNYQSTAAMALNTNYHQPLPPQPPSAANRERDMAEVALACEIMKGDPGMEAWRALELAKHIHNK